jgi:hypothetical protein
LSTVPERGEWCDDRTKRLSVLGTILIEPDGRTLIGRIPDASFFHDDERTIYEAILLESAIESEITLTERVKRELVARKCGPSVFGTLVLAGNEAVNVTMARSYIAQLRPAWEVGRVDGIIMRFREEIARGEGLAAVQSLSDDINEALSAGQPASLITKSWNALDLKYANLPKPPSLFGNRLLVRGSLAMLFGQPGLGKSWLALQLAIAIARGHDLFGVPTTTGNTAIFSLEDPPDVTEDRLNAVCGDNDLGLERITIVPREGLAGPLDLGKPPHVDALISYCKSMHADLLILDALSRVHLADENSNAEMGVVMAAADEIRIRSGACVLFLHHERKPASGPRKGPAIDPYAARGATVLFANLRAQLQLVRHPTGLFQLATTKQNWGPKGESVLWLGQLANGSFTRVTDPAESTAQLDDNLRTVGAWAASWAKEFALEDVVKHLELTSATGEKVSERTVSRYLKVLAGTGELKVLGSRKLRTYLHSAIEGENVTNSVTNSASE